MNEKKHPYGFSGGRQYLNFVLGDNTMHERDSSYSVRQSIRNVFDEIQCFLMPEPSEAVRKGDAKILQGLFINSELV